MQVLTPAQVTGLILGLGVEQTVQYALTTNPKCIYTVTKKANCTLYYLGSTVIFDSPIGAGATGPTGATGATGPGGGGTDLILTGTVLYTAFGASPTPSVNIPLANIPIGYTPDYAIIEHTQSFDIVAPSPMYQAQANLYFGINGLMGTYGELRQVPTNYSNRYYSDMVVPIPNVYDRTATNVFSVQLTTQAALISDLISGSFNYKAKFIKLV